jgi:hydrogenase maturation protease
VHLISAGGEPTSLLDAWTGRDLAVVVDAVRAAPGGEPQPGLIHRFDAAQRSASAGGVDTHGLGVDTALRLGAVLDALPRRLIGFGVEAADLGHGVGMSAPVAAAIPRILQLVRAATFDPGISGSSAGAQEHPIDDA